MDKKTTQRVIIISAVMLVLVLVINPKARAASMKLLAGVRAAIFAKKWVGIGEEGGENKAFTNKVFEEMMKQVGWKSGEAWCMYFAKAVHYDTFPNDRAVINKVLSGSTQGSWANAGNDSTGTYSRVTSGKPQVGDIAIYQLQTDKGKGHAAVVTEVYDDTFQTVEGNTNGENAREGDRVFTKIRPLTIGKNLPNSNLKLLGFIRHKQ